MPPTSFVSGDSGVKWIAVQHAVAHPERFLELPIPSLGGVSLPFVEPFFRVHIDHLHTVTSQAFIVLTAAFVALTGPRGLFVWPGLGFVLAVCSWLWIGLMLDRTRRPGYLTAAGILTTPWLFYGLEFWEHAPALGVGSFGAALLLASADRVSSSHRTALALLGGILCGLGTLLRPEAAIFVGSVTLSALCARDLGIPMSRAALFALSAAAVAAIDVVYVVAHYGTVLPVHVGSNAGLLRVEYLSTRFALLDEWLFRPGSGSAWSVAPASLLGVAAMFTPARSRRGYRFLLGVLLVNTVAVWLLSPNSGGGHWGVRYLLFSYGPLSILTSDLLELVSRRRLVGLSVAIAVLLAGGWIGRSSYRKLRGTKLTYERMERFVASSSDGSAAIVTDLWWLDQIASNSRGRTPFLYVTTADDVAIVFERLHRAGVERVTVVKSVDEPPSALEAGRNGCYSETGREHHTERALTAIRLNRHRCG